jgi:hypothetical protein
MGRKKKAVGGQKDEESRGARVFRPKSKHAARIQVGRKTAQLSSAGPRFSHTPNLPKHPASPQQQELDPPYLPIQSNPQANLPSQHPKTPSSAHAMPA